MKLIMQRRKGMVRTLLGICLSVMTSLVVALPEVIEDMPDNARIWQNLSGQSGSDYAEQRGTGIAFLNEEKGGWYFFDESVNAWRLFLNKDTLDFDELTIPDDVVGFLAYEVLAGSPFLSHGGSAADQGLKLHGPSGELILPSGQQFNPENYEVLRGSKGVTAFYDVITGQWYAQGLSLGEVMASPPTAPYRPLYLNAGMLPARDTFGASFSQDLTFNTTAHTYHRANGNIVGFHPSIAGEARWWRNESDMPCSPYQGYEGQDVLYLNERWYLVRDNGDFQEIAQGRYLNFDETNDREFLEQALTAGTSLGEEGELSQLALRLDGETAQLVDEQGEAVDPSEYNASAHEPLSCAIRYQVQMNEALTLTGVAELPPFVAKSTTFTLTDVVPLYQVQNNPFNDRTVVLSVNQARAIVQQSVQVISPGPAPAPSPDPDPDPDPDPPPPVGDCPLNTPLTLIAALPEGAPLQNLIGISGTNQLNAGFAVVLGAEAIAINNPGNMTTGTVSVGANFSYVSGSALGSQTEGSNLSYRLRRNSDLAEFEVDFTFQSDIVFDDPGIVITSLSGRQCTAGGPL